MKKFSLTLAVAAAICLIIGIWGIPGNNSGQEQTAEQQRYAELMNRSIENFPQKGDVVDGYRMNNPAMFALFDKIKRMDPQTGEVPADGYTKAYKYIQQEWGTSPIQKTGNALVWEERGPSTVGGRSRAILWDPNDSNNKAFFAGGVGGGLWHTNDITVSNPNWTQVSPLFSNVAVTCIYADPTNTQTMYFGTGEGWFNADAIRGAGVWKSTDGGTNWDQLPATDSSMYYYIQDIIVSTTGVLYVGSKSGLYRSTDGGQSFTKTLGSGTGMGSDWITDLEIAGNGDIYAGINGSGIYKSAASLGANQGTVGNWTKLSTSFVGTFDRVELAVGKSNSDYIYVCFEQSNEARNIYRSTNGGGSFSASGSQPNGGNDYSNGQAWYDLCLELDPNDHLTVYTGAIDQYRTTNGGSSWTKLTAAYGGSQPYMHPDQHNIAVNPANSSQVIFSHDGGIWYSSSQGNSPSERNSGYNVTQFYSIAINPKAGSNILIGGTQDNGSKMVNQPGIAPGVNLTGSDGGYAAIDQIYPDTMYTTTQYQTVRRSRNGGGSFTNITNLSLTQSDVMFINPLELDHVNPNNLYQASKSLWRMPNAPSGSSFAWQQITASMGGYITAIAPAGSIADVVYFAANGTVYRASTTFGSSSYSPPSVNPSGLGNGYINCIAVDPQDGNHIIVSFSSFGLQKRVMECRNADQTSAATWTDLTGNLPDLPCNWVVYEPNNNDGILVGTDMGVFRCGDITVPTSQIYWTPESAGMGYPRVDMMKTRYSDNTVHAGTHGRGFFSTSSYNLVPIAAFGVEDTMVCGGYVQFIDSTYNAPTDWLWDFGDGNSSTYPSPTHMYTSSGTYTVKLVVSNPNGSDSTTSTITVTVLPEPTAVAGPDVEGCAGDTVWLSASGGVTYSWWPTTGLNDPYSATPYFVITGSRTFVVTAYDSLGCSDTDTTIVSQLSSPSIWAGQDKNINQGDSVQLQGSGGVTYTWSPSTGLSCTNCATPMASPSVTTTYTCTGTNSNGCSNSDDVVVNVTPVGINDPGTGNISAISIYPNPVSDYCDISFDLAKKGDIGISLLDITGKELFTVYHGSMGPGNHHIRFENNEKIAAGIYFIRFRTDTRSVVKKIIVSE